MQFRSEQSSLVKIGVKSVNGSKSTQLNHRFLKKGKGNGWTLCDAAGDKYVVALHKTGQKCDSNAHVGIVSVICYSV